jgi:protein-S-isoprenylcysteine O-methyltransferase Ste14
MFGRKNLKKSARRYLFGVLVYSLVMVLYTQNGYHQNFIQENTLSVLKIFYAFYLIIGLPLNIVADKKRGHKPELIVKGILSFFKKKKISKEQKTAILFGTVKIFYTPLMLNFFFGNYYGAVSFVESLFRTGVSSFNFRQDFNKIFSVIFGIDTLFFAFGYLFEHKWLKNVVRSVEPTALGWAVALASYPPFNSVTAKYLGWYSSDYFFVPVDWIDYLFKILITLLLLLYLWATLSLGTKASNLTNRGTVSKGAYKYIRHPAYTGKMLAWWIMALSAFSWGALFSLLGWTTIYFMRAITEERHLSKDRDYRRYAKKTPYRFIPGWI